MGLSGTRNKVKIGYDPRNTIWSNDTGRFGHKHLEKLGWVPGKGLGIESSGREATTSHVKVSVKTDNTGLGKKSMRRGEGSLDGEITTGLDVFQRLLGKLNGRDQDAVENQLANQRQRLATSSKFGMVFVHGGFLRPEEPSVIEKEEVEERQVEEQQGGQETVKPIKKRKRSDDKDSSNSKSKKDEKTKKVKKAKKSKKAEPGMAKENSEGIEKDERRKDKSRSKGIDEKAQKAKKAKKAKKSKKTEKSKKIEKDSDNPTEGTSLSLSASSPSPAPTPTPPRSSIPKHLGTRARWITQKRAATMDSKSLNEIFMMKS